MSRTVIIMLQNEFIFIKQSGRATMQLTLLVAGSLVAATEARSQDR
jgi:hypothetical protein